MIKKHFLISFADGSKGVAVCYNETNVINALHGTEATYAVTDSATAKQINNYFVLDEQEHDAACDGLRLAALTKR